LRSLSIFHRIPSPRRSALAVLTLDMPQLLILGKQRHRPGQRHPRDVNHWIGKGRKGNIYRRTTSFLHET
jgi:hypothetical protein